MRVAGEFATGQAGGDEFCVQGVTLALRRGWPGLAAPSMWMLLTTEVAPADLAMRVAAPLCCMTEVWPSQVATPLWTWTWKPSFPILDLASLVWMVCSMEESERA